MCVGHSTQKNGKHKQANERTRDGGTPKEEVEVAGPAGMGSPDSSISTARSVLLLAARSAASTWSRGNPMPTKPSTASVGTSLGAPVLPPSPPAGAKKGVPPADAASPAPAPAAVAVTVVDAGDRSPGELAWAASPAREAAMLSSMAGSGLLGGAVVGGGVGRDGIA